MSLLKFIVLYFQFIIILLIIYYYYLLSAIIYYFLFILLLKLCPRLMRFLDPPLDMAITCNQSIRFDGLAKDQWGKLVRVTGEQSKI